MRKFLFVLSFVFFNLAFCAAQNVTRTQHRTAVAQDVVSTGTMTIRKPDYICISTDGDKEQLIMDGTKFTMTMKGKKHVTDSRKNEQFSTFHQVLVAIINGQPVPTGEDIAADTKNGKTTITITPKKKKRQMFSSFVLTIDAKTSAIRQIRMNERAGNYVTYDI